MKAAVFKASFADWKLIKTRGCVQVIFEIPLHGADEAYQALGGMPNPAAERWFAIAALTDTAGAPPAARKAADAPSDDSASKAPPPSAHKRKVAPEKRLVQQAGIVCTDPVFRRFLGVENEAEAAQSVRTTCGVTSRAQIITGTPAGREWEAMYSRFLAWCDYPEAEI